MRNIRRLALEQPRRRPLKIFAFDPMLGRDALGVVTVDVENEELKLGPVGERVRVVDYDGTHRQYYEPVDLDDPAILMQGGLEPNEADPRFHQQMVYAVTLKVLENFDRALGRRITFHGEPLLVVPHAFRGANAFFDPALKGVVFGYFAADPKNPGPNIPGQPVFSCLSHDIIAHEVTHAVVDRLREHYLEPSNEDVLAFHEAFADIVAIFQHFTFPEVLRDAIRSSSGELLAAKEKLLDLASQFGHATGRGNALRTAVQDPDPARYATVFRAHERGPILVGAVFDGFFETYRVRARNIIRLATHGSGVLPPGELAPALVDALAREAAATAQSILTMCIRAFEYLPVVDVTFGDYLRAMVTADHDLLGPAGAEQRRLMIDAFSRRGIYPEGVASLAEGALLWPRFAGDVKRMPAGPIAREMTLDARRLGRPRGRRRGMGHTTEAAAGALKRWATENAEALGLDRDFDVRLQGFHATFRVGAEGELLIEVACRFDQFDPATMGAGLGPRVRGGTTVVASADGEVRFVIPKPLASTARRERQAAFAEVLAASDPAMPWADPAEARPAAADLEALHRELLPR